RDYFNFISICNAPEFGLEVLGLEQGNG
ncbi:hypothetical protein Gohar_004059, partial [Gossypium harknessii]|nr:hypothetical protein [Gossypium harknessii]